MAGWVVEVIGSVAKGVYLQFAEEVLWELLQKPIYNNTALDTTLRV